MAQVQYCSDHSSDSKGCACSKMDPLTSNNNCDDAMAVDLVKGDIPEAVRRSYDDFCKIRGVEKENFTIPFWDLVVLTAADEDQKEAFELQISEKLRRREIPLGVPYHVFSDPPGTKAGCGTATMFVACKLRELYGEKLDSYRVLLLNCGGQSQRLPSASILGKIFMVLPLGSPALSVFEFKLFCYLPFLERMKPGYFHPASDTIEVFDMGEGTEWSFEEAGFTAIAHPSSLEIGATHGVYALKHNGKGKPAMTELRDCKFVLQKPTIEKMHERNVVLNRMDNGKKTEFVYTDSCFYFDQGVAKMFENFYHLEAPFECEIDGYSDFLQPLGPEATIDFARDLRNVSKVEPRLVEMREKIFNLLHSTQLNIVALNCSKFYHLGTTREYIENFCEDEVLKEEMGLTKQAFCKILPSSSTNKRQKVQLSGTLIHCILEDSSEVAQTAIVEFCHFNSKLTVGSNCVVSSCSSNIADDVTIPNDTFLHTVALRLPEQNNTNVSYATIAFRTSDNIKKKADRQSSQSLAYLGTSLGKFSELCSLKMEDMFRNDCSTFNLWYAKLFPVFDSMEESFKCALDTLISVRDGKAHSLEGHKLVSMADILTWKDAAAMLKYRDDLFKEIIE